jgi:HD-like signal output (HDOD) protein
MTTAATAATAATTGPAATGPASQAVEDLLSRLDTLPSSEPALTRVLQLVNDDNCSARNLGDAVALDPVLTIRLLRLANSAYYGLSGRVATAQRAVTVVGFTTVAALAVSAATGMDTPSAVPEGYWRRAACTAVASSLVARVIGAEQPEAFCAGLLADFGGALLHQADPVAYTDAVESTLAGKVDLVEAERTRFGWAHDELAAHVLSLWKFPASLCAAVGGHHRAVPPTAEPLIRAVRAALIVVAEIPGIAPHPMPYAGLPELTRGRLGEDAMPGLVSQAAAAGGDLAVAIGS